MVGIARWSLCVTAVLFLAASSASAFHGRLGFARPMTATYYYYECIPSGPMVIPVPDARPPLARPTSAPPSGTAEPPLGKSKAASDPRQPVIVASHALATPGKSPALDRARVGFWNLSGRDVTVQIDGKSRTLAKNAAVTLDLERQFTWRLEGQTQQHVERLPDGVPTYEVLIRE